MLLPNPLAGPEDLPAQGQRPVTTSYKLCFICYELYPFVARRLFDSSGSPVIN